ncbi:uncharacterized protein LY89DRAFT_689476 [Mollisia scopiformis]|uniref:Uncharacterized protein n=1 Tax=Mollisia scopiformis TaxID=149040 RepID=A0A194WTC2_MOLSC|nr:uncharacterized protein LY89DRAFT_689476 [Mollisia scopiformis]KUJ10924.1 hypothetical protein LY89DRAFT_689476 [Mollisia scopiformis]
MPKYTVFLIVADRSANRSEEEKKKQSDDVKKDPSFNKFMKEFLDWIGEETNAKRLKSADVLEESTEQTSIRVNFHSDETPAAEAEKDDDTKFMPPTKSLTTRGHLECVSANILGYYTAEFPTINDAATWAQSCPIAFDGFALEIRQLTDTDKTISEATPEVKEWAGDQIVSARKQLVEEGKLKKEEDETLWVKVEDSEEIKEVVTEAEKRLAEKGDDEKGEAEKVDAVAEKEKEKD